MKWIFRLFTLGILLAALAFPFFMKNKQGQPMLSLPGAGVISQLSLPKLPQPAVERTVYKWKDAKGVWHYGDKPPEGAVYKTIQVNDQTNVIQLLSAEERARLQPQPATAVAAPAAAPATTPAPAADSGLSVDRALNLVNEAKAAREQMDTRNRETERIINDAGR